MRNIVLAVFIPFSLAAGPGGNTGSENTGSSESGRVYPKTENLQTLTYSILSIIEREETFAVMLKELVSRIMPIGYDAVEVSAEIIALSALQKVYDLVQKHSAALDGYDKTVNEMITENFNQLKTAVGYKEGTGIAGSGNTGIQKQEEE